MKKFIPSTYNQILIYTFLGVWLWAAVNPKFPADWELENYLLYFFVPAIIIKAKYFRLSNFSYTLITIFLILHVLGAHYTYSQVPFGFTVQAWFNETRNMYDRFVHFSFGFLFAYPVQEVFTRLVKSKGVWSFYFPFLTIISFSALYEVFEWLISTSVNELTSIAFLGNQGDILDSQKDVVTAAVGASIAIFIIALIRLNNNLNLAKEFKKSLRIK